MSRVTGFRWLWRANAVLIFLGGIGALVLLALLGGSIAADSFRSRDNAPETLNAEAVGAERAQLADFESVRGTSVLRAALSTEDRTAYSLGSKGDSGAVLNYLYYDPATGTTRWLFAGGHRLIRQQFWWPSPEYDDEGPVPRAIVYEVSEAVPGARPDESRNATVSIIVADPAGTVVRSVVTKADRITGVITAPDGALEIVYLKNNQLRVVVVGVPQIEALSDRELAVPSLPSPE
jgi:hypothetical protein